MAVVAKGRRTAPARRRDASPGCGAEQARLFVEAVPAAEPAPVPAGPALPPTPVSLDDVLGELFATAGAGRQAVCPLCDGAVRPRPTAAAAHGAGRCDDCGTSFE